MSWGRSTIQFEVAQKCVRVGSSFKNSKIEVTICVQGFLLWRLRSHKLVPGRLSIQFEVAINCVQVGPQLCVPELRNQNILAFFINRIKRESA